MTLSIVLQLMSGVCMCQPVKCFAFFALISVFLAYINFIRRYFSLALALAWLAPPPWGAQRVSLELPCTVDPELASCSSPSNLLVSYSASG